MRVSSVRNIFGVLLIALCFSVGAVAGEKDFWQTTVNNAKGTVVRFNAWGGGEANNAYIDWARKRVAQLYEIDLLHVKISDTADAVRAVWAQKAVGRRENGTIDLVWINGENFKTMKDSKLLYGPIVDDLPNFDLVDSKEKPGTVVDFGVPTDGFEAPWGMTQLIFIHNAELLLSPPKTISAILDYTRDNPGLFTYPAPPQFAGTTFLKQALYELVADPAVLQHPAGRKFDEITKPLWLYLDDLSPNLWRQGKEFPSSSDALLALLDGGEINLAFSFGQGYLQLIENGKLSKSAQGYTLDRGTIGNTHFLGIPFNAANKDAAKVVINFLMSPEAQAHKQNLKVWGDMTILSLARLSPDQLKLFDVLSNRKEVLGIDERRRSLPDLHPSWVSRIEDFWLSRYGG